MIVVCVNVFVKSDYIDEFISATTENHRNSLLEPGIVRFDVLQVQDDASRFILYEVYLSESDMAAHKKTAHYALWRDTVAPWMAKPREGLVTQVLMPTDSNLWKK